jgi:hypothetical protein
LPACIQVPVVVGAQGIAHAVVERPSSEMSQMNRREVMSTWLRGIRGALGRGLIWAIGWAPVAVLIGVLIVDPDNSMDEMWFVVGAYPGFICGVLFSVLLETAERGRRIEEVSLPRLAVWGAAAGLLVGAFPFAIGEATNEVPLWLLVSTVMGSITAMSAASAVGSGLVSRWMRGRQLQPI